MALVPKISLSLSNKCNLVTITEETSGYSLGVNDTGWGGPNINTNAIATAVVKVYPFTYTPAVNAVGVGEISGLIFTDTTHLSGTFQVGQFLTGTGILPGTQITATITGTGSNNGGTYQINLAQIISPGTTITGTSMLNVYVLKDYSTDVYSSQIASPTPGIFTALVDEPWLQLDGIYQIIYSIEDVSNNEYENETSHELFICNLCNCKDGLVNKLLNACDSITVKKLKEQVDQMEMFIYGIQSAFSCGDFDTADNIITAATTYCQTLSDCGCNCGGC
jgi:hypothetical protein